MLRKICLLVLGISLTLVGCNKVKNENLTTHSTGRMESESINTPSTLETISPSTLETVFETATESAENSPTHDAYIPEQISLSLYNIYTRGVDSKVVSLVEITPENIVNALINEKVLGTDTQLQSFNQEVVDGESIIYLDFNDAFTTYIKQFGSAGAGYTQYSLGYTFLDIFPADKLLVTVNGIPPQGPHFDFSYYLYPFQ